MASRLKTGLPLLLAVALLVVPDKIGVASFAPPKCGSYQRRRFDVQRSSERSLIVRHAAETSDGDADLPSPYIEGTQRTLYEVLQCPTSATRAELKQSYVALARQTHPDALIGLDKAAIDADLPDFDAVAKAWKLLSDPRERKRYDRSLKAEAFSKEIEDAAGRAVDAAAPRVKRMLDRVAMPFVRRTTATAVASVEAARQDLDGTKRRGGAAGGGVIPDVGKAFANAVKASRNARRAIDQLELTEKAEELEARADGEAEQAARLRDELTGIIERRLEIALRTPDAPLSSLEALKILDGFNSVDEVSLVASIVMLRRTLTAEIAALEEAEREYYELFDEQATAQNDQAAAAAAAEKAGVNAKAAEEAERRAGEALLAAEQLVASSRKSAEECAANLDRTDSALRKVTTETDKSETALKRRQDRVRRALQRKKEALRVEREKMATREEAEAPPEKEGAEEEARMGEKPVSAGDAGTSSESGGSKANVTDTTADGRTDSDAQLNESADGAMLEELLRRERYLTADSARLEDRAARLRSRASKLVTRANGLDGEPGMDAPPAQ